MLAQASKGAQLLLLAGDLTNFGRPEEAAALADACRALPVRTFAVLGNHDWHCDRHDELISVLAESGITVLEGTSATADVEGCRVGIVGTKGFIGGFAGHSHLDEFGEPALRGLYRETSAEVEALERGLQEISPCPIRIVLLHYSPVRETLAGEPEGIWVFLGCDRLAAPILAHEPDLVLHAHAHSGSVAAKIGEIPVRNVSMRLLPHGFETFELDRRERTSATLH